MAVTTNLPGIKALAVLQLQQNHFDLTGKKE